MWLLEAIQRLSSGYVRLKYTASDLIVKVKVKFHSRTGHEGPEGE